MTRGAVVGEIDKVDGVDEGEVGRMRGRFVGARDGDDEDDG